ncbi:unnamed protein product, partial [marine sediment metagenome]
MVKKPHQTATGRQARSAAGPPPIRLVAMDFDLTIYDHAQPARTLELFDWFRHLDEIGILVGLASGRRVDELRCPLEEIALPWGEPFPHFVICNEGDICTPDGIDWPGAEDWNRRRRDKVRSANAILDPIFRKMVDWASRRGMATIRDIQTGAAGINVVFETPEIAEQVRQELSRRLGECPQIQAERNHHIVLALPCDCSKGAALAELAAIRRIGRSQVLAIGDSFNDRSMLCGAMGFSVAAVANADQVIRREVQAAGGYVSSRRVSRG